MQRLIQRLIQRLVQRLIQRLVQRCRGGELAAVSRAHRERVTQANGGTLSTGFPTHWDSNTNVRWAVDLARPGNGSPIVHRDKVFVCSTEDVRGLGRSLLCFDADSGERLWTRTVTIDKEMPTHKTNPYAGSTPACDGEHVVVWHASAGLHAYGISGEPLWSRDLGEFRHMWGYGSSPIIVGQRVILNSGPGKEVFVAALDVNSGETLWKHDEPVDGDGERNRDAFWGSISLAGDTAYATDQAGNTVVFRLSPNEFTKLADCPLSDPGNATPALAGGRIYVRTDRKLWCIE